MAVFALIGIIIDIDCYGLLWLQIVLGTMCFCMLISLGFSLVSFIPDRNKMRCCNLFFYNDIGKLSDGKTYISIINNECDLNSQLAEQNITVSKIISKKHNKFKIALNLCIASIVLPYFIVLLIRLINFITKRKKEAHMAFNFKNLTNDVRWYMENEVKSDISNGSLYYSNYLSAEGKAEYSNLLIDSIKHGNEETLAASLLGCFKTHYERSKPSGGIILTKVPHNANVTLAEGEFNRFYIRALCIKALHTDKRLKIYRARYSKKPRLESENKIGQFIDAKMLLNDLKNSPGIEAVLGLPEVNSGLSVEIVD